MYINHEENLARQLNKIVESELSKIGLLYRVFSRAKTQESINKKIISKGEGYYSKEGKKIQDIFGVRVALYFLDDLSIAQKALERIFDLVSKEVDPIENTIFSSQRCNYVFRLPEDISSESDLVQNNELVDNTFEVQFRTVLSEGWHEVEHDLRYKCKSDWGSHNDLNRNLNGIYATLETSDWGMLKLFEDLAYRNYKSEEWNAMFRNKFRLRITDSIEKDIIDVLENNKEIGKLIYRLNREKVLNMILDKDFSLPINPSNLIYFANHFIIKSPHLTSITPKAFIEQLH